MLKTPSLLEPNNENLKLIASKVIVDKDFRVKIGGSSLVSSIESEFQFWQNYINDKYRTIVLAYSGEKIIGFFALDEIKNGSKIARAHVHFWEQSKTLPELCEMFLDHCRYELGLERLWGMTDSFNYKAWKFAQKIGFKASGLIPNYYRSEKGLSDCIISNLELFPEID